MQVGSIVEYIGGQDHIGRKISPLERNVPYVVTCMCEGKFKEGWKPAIYIDLSNDFAHLMSMFKEIAPPEEVNIEELLAETIKL